MEVDEGLNSLNFCRNCHYSCKTCVGPRKTDCSSCCMNADCGPALDRVPNLGICDCPPGTSESNGVCSFKCLLNLGGKLGDMCYT